MTLAAVEVVALIATPSVAVAARGLVVAVKLVKQEVVAASKVLVVLVVAGILVVVLVIEVLAVVRAIVTVDFSVFDQSIGDS